MLKEDPKRDLTEAHLLLRDQIDSLFRRRNLVSNFYFSKHLKTGLQLPLYVLVQERKISQITTNEDIIRESIAFSRYVRQDDARTVLIIDHPTFRLPYGQMSLLSTLQGVLVRRGLAYDLNEIRENNCWQITVESEDCAEALREMIEICPQLQKANLLEDMRIEAQRIKKQKQESASHPQQNGRNRNIYDKNPSIFIRKAVESDEEDSLEPPRKEEKKKKYKEAVKAVINMDDFPSLT